MKVDQGQTVTLACTVTPGDIVTWIQVQNSNEHFLYIYKNGQIHLPGIKHRYSVLYPENGDYTLTIINIQPNDAGRYFCLRGNFTQMAHYVTNVEHFYARTLKLYIVYVTGKIYELYIYAIMH